LNFLISSNFGLYPLQIEKLALKNIPLGKIVGL